MTWSETKQIAEKAVEAMGLPADLAGVSITFVDFESERDYEALVAAQERTGTLTFHRMVLQASERLLRKRGATVSKIVLNRAAYEAWLSQHNLPNLNSTRAAFVQIQDEPPPVLETLGANLKQRLGQQGGAN